MEVNRLQVPKRLVAFIDLGVWPRDDEGARRQNLSCPVLKERIQLLAPEEERIFFYPPPFRSVAQRMTGGEEAFWLRFGALEGISPPILLDYRQNRADPTIIRLLWRKPNPNEWVVCAKDFDEFADKLELGTNSLQP
jgi:hypothetical protein